MYLSRSLRVIAPVVLGISLTARPASAHTTPVSTAAAHTFAISGLYRLTLVGQKTRAEQRVDLILEHSDSGYTALMLSATDATWLEHVTFDGETLRGNAKTSAGRGELTLHVTLQGISGTLIVGTHTITVKGERAS